MPVGSGLSTRSPYPSSPRELSGPPIRAKRWRAPLGSGGSEAWFLAEAELGPVAPHPMQDDGELASNGDAGPCHAARLGHLHAPRTQAGPLAAAHQQGVGRLVQGGAGQFVTASADLAGDVSLAGLIAGRRQP